MVLDIRAVWLAKLAKGAEKPLFFLIGEEIMAAATYSSDNTARATRTVEVPDASWDTGLNYGGGNNVGIGINAGGGEVVGTPEQFTLLDQNGAARTPQNTQSIGGTALNDGSATGFQAIWAVFPTDDGSGDVQAGSVAALPSLAAGWTTVVGGFTAATTDIEEETGTTDIPE